MSKPIGELHQKTVLAKFLNNPFAKCCVVGSLFLSMTGEEENLLKLMFQVIFQNVCLFPCLQKLILHHRHLTCWGSYCTKGQVPVQIRILEMTRSHKTIYWACCRTIKYFLSCLKLLNIMSFPVSQPFSIPY